MCDVVWARPVSCLPLLTLFFSKPPPTTEIYTLSLHDALPILVLCAGAPDTPEIGREMTEKVEAAKKQSPNPIVWIQEIDRKSTRLNSSHVSISYAVFCLKKKMASDNRCRAGCRSHALAHPEIV